MCLIKYKVNESNHQFHVNGSLRSVYHSPSCWEDFQVNKSERNMDLVNENDNFLLRT